MPGADFVIITALDEERDAVLAKFEATRKLEKDGLDVHTWYETTLRTRRQDGASYRVIITSLAGMGPLMATTKAQAVVTRWHPKNVLLVGIACGMPPPKTALGDVLVSRQIADYTLGKVHPDGTRTIRWDVHHAGANLLDAAVNLAPEEWIPLITAERPEPGMPVRHCDVIISGGDVVSNAKLTESYGEDWSKLIGIEMEAGGTATGLHESPDPPEFLMVKGVSDFGEGKHDVDVWRPYASDAAAAFAAALIRAGTGPAVSTPASRRRIASLATLVVAIVLALGLGLAWMHARRDAAVVRLNNRGIETLTARQDEEARDAFMAALRLDPHNAPAHSNLAAMDAAAGKLQDAIRHAEAAAHAAPEVALYHYNLGMLLARAERFEDALASLQRAISRAPRYAKAYNEIGNIQLKLGRATDARKALLAGLAIDPRFAPLSKNLARVALTEQHAGEAVRLLHAALANYGNDSAGRAEATYWLASAESALAHRAAVCGALKNLAQLDPNRLTEFAPAAQRLGKTQGCDPWI